MNAHHKASFILASMFMGAAVAPWLGQVLAATAAGVFSVAGVFVNGWVQRRRTQNPESAVVTALAKELVAKEAEIERLVAELRDRPRD